MHEASIAQRKKNTTTFVFIAKQFVRAKITKKGIPLRKSLKNHKKEGLLLLGVVQHLHLCRSDGAVVAAEIVELAIIEIDN